MDINKVPHPPLTNTYSVPHY